MYINNIVGTYITHHETHSTMFKFLNMSINFVHSNIIWKYSLNGLCQQGTSSSLQIQYVIYALLPSFVFNLSHTTFHTQIHLIFEVLYHSFSDKSFRKSVHNILYIISRCSNQYLKFVNFWIFMPLLPSCTLIECVLYWHNVFLTFKIWIVLLKNPSKMFNLHNERISVNDVNVCGGSCVLQKLLKFNSACLV